MGIPTPTSSEHPGPVNSGRVGGCIEVGPIGGDEVAQAGASREHTVIADLVGAGGRDQGGELAEEVEGLEEQRLGAVAPGMLQAVEQASVGELGEALGGESGARDVAEETLEAAPVLCVDGDVGVEVEATGGGAARACAPLDVVGVDAIAEALEALAGARTERDATLDGGAVEGGQRGVGLGERIVLEMLFVVCEERAMEQEGLESAGDVLGDVRDLGVVGRRERMEAGRGVRGGGIA